MATNIDGAISSIKLSGFKSIKNAELEFNNLNVFIGANGSGKSNLISFFQMMNAYLTDIDGFGWYVGRNNGADKLLYFGSERTESIFSKTEFYTSKGNMVYDLELGASYGNKLYFKNEAILFAGNSTKPLLPLELGSGGTRSQLHQLPEYKTDSKNSNIKDMVTKWCFYQFHNTSGKSLIRAASRKDDTNYLYSDGHNLASFLFMLSERYPDTFSIIIQIMKRIAPYIKELILKDEYDSSNVSVKWSEKSHPDYLLDATQMSDGTIRALALATLLLQPKKPPVICIDEPELGLHPEAIEIIADLIRIASETSQIILSTQSPRLVDCFEPEDIIVVDKNVDGTCFNRLEYERYKAWLDDYSISQVWDTNIFGGNP